MRIMITGGAGFIGRNCAARFAAGGHEVVCVDNLSVPWAHVDGHDLRPVDVRSLAPEDLDVDTLLHLAALKSVPHSFEDPTQIIHNISVDHHVMRVFSMSPRPQRLVLAGSCEIYGNHIGPSAESRAPDPLSPYAVGKLTTEHMAAVYRALLPHKEISVLRLHNIFGPDEGGEAIISSFIDSILDGNPLVIEGPGDQSRDFTFIDDASEMIWRVVTDPSRPAEIMNIGSGKAVTIREIAGVLEQVAGHELVKIHAAPRLNEISAFLADMSAYIVRYGQVPTRPMFEALRWTFNRRADLRSSLQSRRG